MLYRRQQDTSVDNYVQAPHIENPEKSIRKGLSYGARIALMGLLIPTILFASACEWAGYTLTRTKNLRKRVASHEIVSPHIGITIQAGAEHYISQAKEYHEWVVRMRDNKEPTVVDSKMRSKLLYDYKDGPLLSIEDARKLMIAERLIARKFYFSLEPDVPKEVLEEFRKDWRKAFGVELVTVKSGE
tara:strand:- start:860 stop:1420 length:561 start_codon:yes stop_codon:yes gene_type:complete